MNSKKHHLKHITKLVVLDTKIINKHIKAWHKILDKNKESIAKNINKRQNLF